MIRRTFLLLGIVVVLFIQLSSCVASTSSHVSASGVRNDAIDHASLLNQTMDRWTRTFSLLQSNMTRLAERESMSRSSGTTLREKRFQMRNMHFKALENIGESQSNAAIRSLRRSEAYSGLYGPEVRSELVRKSTMFSKLMTSSLNGQHHPNPSTFKELILGPNRDYWVFLLATATGPEFRCAHCTRFARIYTPSTMKAIESSFHIPTRPMLGNDFVSKDEKSHVLVSDQLPIYFVTIDASVDKEAFKVLGITQAPLGTIIPPSYGNEERLNPRTLFTSGDPRLHLSVGHIHTQDDFFNFLERHTGRKSNPPPPSSPVPALLALSFALAIAVFLAWRFWVTVISLIRSFAPLFGALSALGYLFAVSGSMFNSINKTPFVGTTSKHSVSFINPGMMEQYGIESLIVAVLFSFITVTLLVSTIATQTTTIDVVNQNQDLPSTSSSSLTIPYSRKFWGLTQTVTEQVIGEKSRQSLKEAREVDESKLPLPISFFTQTVRGLKEKIGADAIIFISFALSVVLWINLLNVYGVKNPMYNMGFVW